MLLILAVAFCAADGGALRQVLSERTVHPNLDWGLRVRWLAEITEGLQRLHSLRPRALIHRDLKAANVLLSCGGGGSGGNLSQAVAKVSDFGVASFMETMASRASAGGVGAAAATSSCGAGGGATGTLAWKAPETFAGRYSTASDVFGLGVTAFELISRRLGEVGSSWRLTAHTLELRQQACSPAADHAHHFRKQSTELSRRKRLHEAEAARWQHKETTRRLKLESVDADGRARIARVGVRMRCCFVCAKLVHNPCLLP